MGKERTMKLRTLIKNVKKNEEKAGIGNRLVYSILDSNKKCNIIVTDYTNLKSGLNLKPISDIEKEREEKKLLSKEIIDNNLIIIDNANYRFPVISLDSEDIQNSSFKYIIIDFENKESIEGRELVPWIYDYKKRELLIWQDKIEIKRDFIKAEIKVSKNRNILILNDGKNFVTLR